MLSAIFSVIGVFIGLLIVAVLIGTGFAVGAYKLLKGIIGGVIGLFSKKKES